MWRALVQGLKANEVLEEETESMTNELKGVWDMIALAKEKILQE